MLAFNHAKRLSVSNPLCRLFGLYGKWRPLELQLRSASVFSRTGAKSAGCALIGDSSGCTLSFNLADWVRARQTCNARQGCRQFSRSPNR